MLTLILNIIAFLLIGFFLLMGLASFYCCLKAESHEEWWTYLKATILFNCGWAVVGITMSLLQSFGIIG